MRSNCEQQHTDYETCDTQRMPNRLPGNAVFQHRSHHELTCRSTQHPEALCDAYGGGQPARCKTVRRKIDRTGKSKGRTGTL